jgi:chromosome segregation ATPase
MSNEQILIKMKEEIEQTKTKKSRLEGEIDSIKSQLSALGYASIEEAEKKQEELEKTILELSKTVDEKLQTLKTTYEWKTI